MKEGRKFQVLRKLPSCNRLPVPCYRNTLYGIWKTCSRRLAILKVMGLLPLSMEQTQSSVVPSLCASSPCVHSIFPRNPRRAMAGDASPNTSSALVISSPSGSFSRTVNPARDKTDRMALAIAPALFAGTVIVI
mgnify:FL=1